MEQDVSGEATRLAGQAAGTLTQIITHYLDKIILPVAAFVVGLFFFYGVAKYFTAYGDEAKAESAKKTITWAVIGAIVVLLSFRIIGWVRATMEKGGNPSQFKVPASKK